MVLAASILVGCAVSTDVEDDEDQVENVEAPGAQVQDYGDNNLQCFPSYKSCIAVCLGVCERRINCGGASAHKCFEP
jgi:hypothetical protein